MSTIIFVAGVLIGGCLGAGIMAFFHAQDDPSEDDHHNICEDCIHKSKRPWDAPCNSCDGYACNYHPEEE